MCSVHRDFSKALQHQHECSKFHRSTTQKSVLLGLYKRECRATVKAKVCEQDARRVGHAVTKSNRASALARAAMRNESTHRTFNLHLYFLLSTRSLSLQCAPHIPRRMHDLTRTHRKITCVRNGNVNTNVSGKTFNAHRSAGCLARHSDTCGAHQPTILRVTTRAPCTVR